MSNARPEQQLFIGLMSGTSADSIDAALVDFSGPRPQLLHYIEQPLDSTLREQILALMQPGADEIERLGRLDHQLGHAFAKAALTLLELSNTRPCDVRAIGSHGQTVRHRPPSPEPSTNPNPFTLQIGDANIIAERTGIATVADFRRRDMAAGGQGAPLVPAFHQAVFSSKDERRVIANIGGMANITILDAESVSGFDTGPGNALMDSWVARYKSKTYDHNGEWAASGNASEAVIQQLLGHPFFQLAPPKSTGREDFHLAWLDEQLQGVKQELEPADIQASLLEVTAASIAASIAQQAPATEALYVCGGGAFNAQLLKQLQLASQAQGLSLKIDTTSALGIAPQSVEAAAFAWLAKQTLAGLPGNNPAATGASRERVLGGIYPA